MDLLALIVGVAAIVAAIFSAVGSSVRNEAHHQATVIQDLIKDISEITHNYFFTVTGEASTQKNCGDKVADTRKAMIYESKCSMRCDLLESALQLLVRRCSRSLLFDADVEVFRSDFVGLLGSLRDTLSVGAYSSENTVQSILVVDAGLVRLHMRLNDYISERFRPVFETAQSH
ncbi:hypothetical protein ACLE2W_06480 [Pseudomonas shahriarae]|uniref:hypothetical protein n=1 Tax=Pseudomonas shahriarae TaxID=2745512 RepID=UPI002076982F|nr:hypothetical protein [Pseudomonas shahriarae]MCM8559771.1 hypothetical protein [Pseudomonas shahriarae]